MSALIPDNFFFLLERKITLFVHGASNSFVFNCINFQFQKVVTLGEETINTPVFTQLDHNEVFLVTETLTRFVLVGEAATPLITKPVKHLRLALFGVPPTQSSNLLEYSVRAYVVEDTKPALEVMQLPLRMNNIIQTF